MAMLQRAKLFTKGDLRVLTQNLKNHQLKVGQDLVLVHILLKMMLKANLARLMYKDLMKTQHNKLVQNLKYQDIQYSQNQRVKFFRKLEVKQARKHQACFLKSQNKHRLQDGRMERMNKRILKMLRSQLRKMLLLLMKRKRMNNQHKKRDLWIQMKLRRLSHLCLNLSQLPVRLVKCLEGPIFHNFRDSSKRKRMQGKIWNKN